MNRFTPLLILVAIVGLFVSYHYVFKPRIGVAGSDVASTVAASGIDQPAPVGADSDWKSTLAPQSRVRQGCEISDAASTQGAEQSLRSHHGAGVEAVLKAGAKK